MIRIAIFGFGTVGMGVAETLELKRPQIEREVGEYRIVAVADSRSSIYGDFDVLDAIREKSERGRLPRDVRAEELFDAVDFDLLIDTTPTNVFTGEPGLGNIKEAIRRGIDVITSNKGPLVVAFREIMEMAERHGVKVGYEATVGGAMPVIKLVRKDLAGNRVKRVRGILNGTTNYILSRMEKERMPYSQILSEAQELGIAEADPSYDVKGIDVGAKLVILANSVFGMDARFEDVRIMGIEGITPEAFEVAGERGYTIRLIAEADENGKLEVSPRLVKLTHPLAIYGTLNALLVETDLAGEVFVIGRGAGRSETASAIISDFVDIYGGGSSGN
ncbi:homoserine dehydrogenase [Geoglobus ahangari]|uniref:Homoserine dehydrogenase n=1 Tax=Geoglobus ahangari TaxID=113653 RepID=A0A0F7DBY6_9EURY|nr:homoserine dehydrogenase [Geoglobus ahangari]AKG91906.1 homoserine dehydrogenase [Geoglobus ahangari]